MRAACLPKTWLETKVMVSNWQWKLWTRFAPASERRLAAWLVALWITQFATRPARKQFGRLLAEHQLVQAKLADMITELDAARLLVYRAAYARDTTS